MQGTRRSAEGKLPAVFSPDARATASRASGILRNRRGAAYRAGSLPLFALSVSSALSVLGLLDSAPVVLAIVFGIPAAIGLVVAAGLSRRTPVIVLAAGSLVVAGLAVLAVWAVFQEPSASRAASPGSRPQPGRPLDVSCAPSGTRLEETARGIAFGTKCLAAPAGRQFTIRFDNQDQGTPHNIHIFSGDPTRDPNARSFFEGELVTGPRTATYAVPALQAGTYFFHCDVHPTQMFGGFVVA